LALVEKILLAFESGDLSVSSEVLAPDAVVAKPSGTMRRPEEFAQRVRRAFVGPFSDPSIKIIHAIEAENEVAAEIKTTVRHTGTMSMPDGDLPATGNTVVIEEVSVVKIKDSKIVS
jgi:ketosteroid isomerase-like protein